MYRSLILLCVAAFHLTLVLAVNTKLPHITITVDGKDYDIPMTDPIVEEMQSKTEDKPIPPIGGAGNKPQEAKKGIPQNVILWTFALGTLIYCGGCFFSSFLFQWCNRPSTERYTEQELAERNREMPKRDGDMSTSGASLGSSKTKSSKSKSASGNKKPVKPNTSNTTLETLETKSNESKQSNTTVNVSRPKKSQSSEGSSGK